MKNRIKNRLTKINEWTADHAEAMVGLGVGLIAGGGIALYSIIKTEQDHKLATADVYLGRDGTNGLLVIENVRGDVQKMRLENAKGTQPEAK